MLRFPKISEIFQNIFLDRSKIFFGKVEIFFEHQGRSKICLRIEWKHSQSLKNTLKHSYCQNMKTRKKKLFFRDFENAGHWSFKMYHFEL